MSQAKQGICGFESLSLEYVPVCFQELMLFPAMMESVFNSIGSVAGPPLVVDTGALCCISPCRDDFIEYTTDSSVKIKDLSGINKVAGEGLVRWIVLDRFGREQMLEMKAYHI
jgi:hypothetical protein